MMLALKVLSAFFLAASFLLPNHYYPWGSFYLEFSAILFALSLVLLSTFQVKKIPVPLFFFSFAVLCTVPFIQHYLGQVLFLGDALISSSYVFVFLASCFLGYAFISGPKSEVYVMCLAYLLLVIGLVSVWISLAQWLGVYQGIWVHGIPSGGRPFGNLGQPNNYATLIYLSYFSLFFLFERKAFSLPILIFSSLFLLVGLALAQSRTSWVVLICLISAVFVSHAIFRRYYKCRLIWLLLSALGFYLSGLVLEVLSTLLDMHNQLEIRSHVKDIRIDMWQAFFSAISERPFWGYGWGQVSLAQLAVSEIYPQTGLTQYTHNLALDLMVWNGIPLGILVLFLILLLFLKTYLNSFSSYGFYFFASLGALMVHSMFEYPHAYAYFTILAGLFFGAGVFRSHSNSEVFRPAFRKADGFIDKIFQRKVCLNRLVILPVMGISLIGLSIVWYEYRVIEEDQRLLRFEAASIGTLRATQKAPDVMLIDQLQSFLWVARTHSFDNLTDDDAKLIHSVAKRYPLPMPLLKRAQLIAAQGEPEEAVDSLAAIKPLYGSEVYESTVNALERFQSDIK